MKTRKQSHRWAKTGHVFSILLILLWSLFPIYWALNTSLTTQIDAQSRPASYWPHPLDFSNYSELLGFSDSGSGLAARFGRSMLNTVIEAGGSMILTVVIAVFASYAFARLRLRFKRVILAVVLTSLMLPGYAILIPIYQIMVRWGLINTYLGVILVYTTTLLPLAIWILYNYFLSIPEEMSEAASIDGASAFQTLLWIIVPTAIPGIAATAIITFLFAWAQFLFPLVLTTDITTQPVTVLVAAMNGQRLVPYTQLMAVGVLAVAPPGILALILNRYIVQGMTSGGVK